jgi:hypothetical protein
VAYRAGLGGGMVGLACSRAGLVCGWAGPLPRSADAALTPMACARTVQNPGERTVQRTGPAPDTAAQPPAAAVTTGKLLVPAAKLSR